MAKSRCGAVPTRGFDQWATAKELPRIWRRSFRPQLQASQTGEIVKCDFNPGLFVSRKMMKGSRLRLVVTAVNSIFWQKNYCSGGVVAEETAQDAHTCHVQVYHDAQHASSIQLPLRWWDFHRESRPWRQLFCRRRLLCLSVISVASYARKFRTNSDTKTA